MKLKWLFLLLIYTVLVSGCHHRYDPKFDINKFPKNYSGSFRWFEGDIIQKVFVRLHEIKIDKEGKIIAFGKGAYDGYDGVIYIDIKWKIDSRTLSFEMWESGPDYEDFVTDGSHIGKISDDFKTIKATWTTKGTREKGGLGLYAE